MFPFDPNDYTHFSEVLRTFPNIVRIFLQHNSPDTVITFYSLVRKYMSQNILFVLYRRSPHHKLYLISPSINMCSPNAWCGLV